MSADQLDFFDKLECPPKRREATVIYVDPQARQEDREENAALYTRQVTSKAVEEVRSGHRSNPSPVRPLKRAPLPERTGPRLSAEETASKFADLKALLDS